MWARSGFGPSYRLYAPIQSVAMAFCAVARSSLPSANQFMQAVFQPVLHMRVPGNVVWLRPQICEVVRAPQFERDQMVHLTTDALSSRSTVGCVDLALNRSR